MRTRQDRRAKKAAIKANIIARVIADMKRWKRNHTEEFKEEHLRRCLRNEGKARQRCYECGAYTCDYCLGNKTHKHKKKEAILNYDLSFYFESGENPTRED